MTNIKKLMLTTAIISIVTAGSAQAATFTNEDDGTPDNLVLDADSIVAGDIATSAVTTDEILDGTITEDDLAADSVGASELDDDSVASANIIDGTITSADLSAPLNNAITGNTAAITNLQGEVEDLKGGVASAIAIATIPGVPAGKQFAIGFGGGTYDGENAGALKLSFAPAKMPQVQLSASATLSDGATGAGVGVSYGF